MTSTVQSLIGVILLIIGAWVTWSGVQQNEVITIILGVAALIGGVAFLIGRSKGGVTRTRD